MCIQSLTKLGQSPFQICSYDGFTAKKSPFFCLGNSSYPSRCTDFPGKKFPPSPDKMISSFPQFFCYSTFSLNKRQPQIEKFSSPFYSGTKTLQSTQAVVVRGRCEPGGLEACVPPNEGAGQRYTQELGLQDPGTGFSRWCVTLSNFFFFFFNWSRIALQCCISFCCTMK